MPSLEEYRNTFQETGFLRPFQFLLPGECQSVHKAIRACSKPPVWDKATATICEDCYRVATRSELLAILQAILGKDFMLWGACLVTKKPGEVHPWHTDIETAGISGGTANVWIGLKNTNSLSSLALVSHSHEFEKSLAEITSEARIKSSDVKTEDVRRWARSRNPASEIIQPELSDGEALIFDGRLWHGSHNTNLSSARTALLLQYATPGAKIRIPDSRRQYEWPFEYQSGAPPCIMVRGFDGFGINNLTATPPVSSKSKLKDEARIRSSLVKSSFRQLQESPITGWKYEYLFEGSTSSVNQLSIHALELSPDTMPHNLHQHAAEELVILLEGNLEIEQIDDENSAQPRKDRIGPNSFVYHYANQMHTQRSIGPDRARYYALKWLGNPVNDGNKAASAFLFDSRARIEDKKIRSKKGLTFTHLFSAQTSYLGKLHIHIDCFEPGTGYAEHSDPYDIFIVVLSGVVETLEKKVSASGFIFHPANVVHSLQNVASSTAQILVIEFEGIGKGMHSDTDRLEEMREWEASSLSAAIDIEKIVPQGTRIILVDDNQLGVSYFKVYHVQPFLEHKGEYWGSPPFDETAINELERMRSTGAEYLVFCWPAFWWLDYYRDFKAYIDSNFDKVLMTNHVAIYNLQTGQTKERAKNSSYGE